MNIGNGISGILLPLRLALSLLTRIPVGRLPSASPNVWANSTVAFPLCGYVLAVLSLIPYLAITFLPAYGRMALPLHLLSAVAYVLSLAWWTRGFHLDGFSDACDGFSAMTDDPRERLRIMKDPHPGATGVAGLILFLLLKTVVVFLVFSLESGEMELLIILVAGPAIARAIMLLLAAVGHYPRETGTAAALVGKIPPLALVFAWLSLVPALFFIPVFNLAVAMLSAATVFFFWKRSADRMLGGVTGDILGACCESTELVVILALAVLELAG